MIATAAPIETPPPLESLGAPAPPLESAGALESVGALESAGWTALPSAVACASVSAEVESAKRPPAWMVIAPIVAREIDVARLIATAAAMSTPPPLVEAVGVLSAPPDPSPPFAVDVSLANDRSPATC